MQGQNKNATSSAAAAALAGLTNGSSPSGSVNAAALAGLAGAAGLGAADSLSGLPADLGDIGLSAEEIAALARANQNVLTPEERELFDKAFANATANGSSGNSGKGTLR
jgi:hypothetical protein